MSELFNEIAPPTDLEIHIKLDDPAFKLPEGKINMGAVERVLSIMLERIAAHDSLHGEIKLFQKEPIALWVIHTNGDLEEEDT